MQLTIPSNAITVGSPSGGSIALQPGQIVDALVLQLLEDGKARIAIANTVMDVASKVPLVPGTTIQLAVKGLATELTLSLVDGGQGTPTAAGSSAAASAPATGVGETQSSPATAGNGATPAAALSQAVGRAAAQQNGLAPLFADIAEAAKADSLPQPVQQAMGRLQTFLNSTASPVTAADVRQAFSRSGLFFEARLAAAGGADATGAASAPTEADDLKAALIAFRQVLKTWLDTMPTAKPGATPSGTVSGAGAPSLGSSGPGSTGSGSMGRGSPGSDSMGGPPQPSAAVTPAAPAEAGPAGVEIESTLARNVIAAVIDPRLARGGDLETIEGGASDAPPASATTDSGRVLSALERSVLLSMVERGGPLSAPDRDTLLALLGRDGSLSAPDRGVLLAILERCGSLSEQDRAAILAMLEPGVPPSAPEQPSSPGGTMGPATNIPPEASEPPSIPPPPYPGAPMAAQPPALASTSAGDDAHTIGARLLAGTDAALARQTLLQAASLPETTDPGRRDAAAQRWTFEIPFATPNGTAVAQFEISRDGRQAAADAAKPAWRARFSLDVEPMGPVHVQISLSGARTAVTMWAERPESAARLREDAPLLADALVQAEVGPSDVLVRDGEPPRRPQAAAAGHFLDRAS